MEDDLESVLIGLDGDIRFWKRMMGELATLFQEQFPPRAGTKHVWLLVVQKCSASKNCGSCPHSIVWRLYFYPKGERKKRKLFGSRNKNSIERRLPKYMRVTREILEIFQEFETARMIIMREHRNLTKIQGRLLALKREAKKRRAGVSESGMANVMRDLHEVDASLKSMMENCIWKLGLEVPRILEARRKIREEKNRRLLEGWPSSSPSEEER